MSTTALKSATIVTVAAAVLAVGVVINGQTPQDDIATESKPNAVRVEILVNEDEPRDRTELLTQLLTLEAQQYEAMSLRDENWNERPQAFATARESFAPEFRAITGWDELLTLDQYFAILNKTKLNASRRSAAQLTVVNASAVVLSYKLEENVIDRHGGHQSKNRVSSTWVQRGIRWVKVFEQSTRAGDPFPQP